VESLYQEKRRGEKSKGREIVKRKKGGEGGRRGTYRISLDKSEHFMMQHMMAIFSSWFSFATFFLLNCFDNRFA
jgi:hypothetical protein